MHNYQVKSSTPRWIYFISQFMLIIKYLINYYEKNSLQVVNFILYAYACMKIWYLEDATSVCIASILHAYYNM